MIGARLSIRSRMLAWVREQGVISGIGDVSATDAGEGRERVLFRFGGADNFEDADFAHGKGVGHERAEAAPRDRFSAHESSGMLFGEFDHAIERRREFVRLHVVRKAAKAGVAPTEIDGIGFRVAQTAERL